MPKGIKNGTNELAKAYIHGRIDATRELLIAGIDKKLKRELKLWSYRFALNPMEVKQNMGKVSFTAQTDSMPSSGMQYATEQREGNAVAALEVAQRAHGVRASLGSRSGDSQNAPGQIEAAMLSTPAQTSAKKDSSKIKAYWASMTPEQRSAVLRDKLIVTSKKRKLTAVEKSRLETLTAKAKGVTAPKRGEKADKKEKQSKKPSKRILSDAERMRHANYVARAAAKKQGLPMPPLLSEVAAA